jgi:hypothetical protein
MPAYHSAFDSSRSSSFVSSPLASSSSHAIPASRPRPIRTPSFPPSRPLRPFASIAQSIASPKMGTSMISTKKPVKLIEPPKNQRAIFLLNLTQAELSRQEWGWRVLRDLSWAL